MSAHPAVIPGVCAAASPEPMNSARTECGVVVVEHHWERTMFMGSGLSAHALPRNDAEAQEFVA